MKNNHEVKYNLASNSEMHEIDDMIRKIFNNGLYHQSYVKFVLFQFTVSIIFSLIYKNLPPLSYLFIMFLSKTCENVNPSG